MDAETIVLGGGCFWCTEAIFEMLKGILSVEPGYAGPLRGKPPTYEEVCTGTTPYAEATKIVFNPEELAFEEILRVFFASHDPTTLNRQGNDVGPQYRSVIFTTTPRQAEKSRHYIEALNKGGYVKPIVTAVEELEMFYPAEDYHKKYFETHKDAPYCQLVIAPKVEKVSESFKSLLKK
jgi:peptide-methionine (S)-S-oxide reductase